MYEGTEGNCRIHTGYFIRNINIVSLIERLLHLEEGKVLGNREKCGESRK